MTDETEEATRPKHSFGSTTLNREATGESVTLTYDWGGSLDEMVEKFGADVVFYFACGHMTASFRNRAYSILRAVEEDGETVSNSMAEIEAQMSDWQPKISAGRSKKSSSEKALDSFDGMTEDEKSEFMVKLQEKIAAG